VLRRRVGQSATLAAWLICCACGSVGNPSAPTPPISGPSAAPNGSSLSVSAFSVAGWYDGTLHYVPKLSVAAGPGGDVHVQEVRFSKATTGEALSSVHYNLQPRVPAGRTVELSQGHAFEEIPTSTVIDRLAVSISFSDDVGHSGNTVAEVAVPPVPQGPSAAALTIRSFSVTSSFHDGRFWYQPKLTLAETSGVSDATVASFTFNLLDLGAEGRVPVVRSPIVVPAGGMLVLDQDPLGYGPWVELDSASKASRVAVVISYLDSAGRGRSVGAEVQVSGGS